MCVLDVEFFERKRGKKNCQGHKERFIGTIINTKFKQTAWTKVALCLFAMSALTTTSTTAVYYVKVE